MAATGGGGGGGRASKEFDESSMLLDDVEEVFDGKAILFDGNKNYPVQKLIVDFVFVEHLDYNCIEIIGKCQEKQSEAPRIYLKAKELYDKVEADKRAKDKKNRRSESVLSKKLIRNMAVQSILLRLNIDRGVAFGLKLTAFDGINFQISQPQDLVPHSVIEKMERRQSSSTGNGEMSRTSSLDMAPAIRHGSTGSILGSINTMPEGVGISASATELHAALGDLKDDAADLNLAAEQAKESSSMFVNTIDNIKEMFDFRQKWREEHSDANKKTDMKKRRMLRNGRPVELKSEETREQHKKNRYSLTVKPQEGISLEEAQVAGREAPGGGPLTKLVGSSKTAVKNVSTGAAKAVLVAAGFVASNLSGKRLVAVGGQELKIVPKPLADTRGGSVRLTESSNGAVAMLKRLGGSFRGFGSSNDGKLEMDGVDQAGLTSAEARQRAIDSFKAAAAAGGSNSKMSAPGGVGSPYAGGMAGRPGAGAAGSDGGGMTGGRRNSDSDSVLTRNKVDVGIDDAGSPGDSFGMYGPGADADGMPGSHTGSTDGNKRGGGRGGAGGRNGMGSGNLGYSRMNSGDKYGGAGNGANSQSNADSLNGTVRSDSRETAGAGRAAGVYGGPSIDAMKAISAAAAKQRGVTGAGGQSNDASGAMGSFATGGVRSAEESGAEGTRSEFGEGGAGHAKRGSADSAHGGDSQLMGSYTTTTATYKVKTTGLKLGLGSSSAGRRSGSFETPSTVAASAAAAAALNDNGTETVDS